MRDQYEIIRDGNCHLPPPPPPDDSYEVPAYKVGSKNDKVCYVGPLTSSQAALLLKPSEYCIYYQMPEKSAAVAYKLPLYLAYKNVHSKEVLHCPIICRQNEKSGKNLWSLNIADSPTFPSLNALVKGSHLLHPPPPNDINEVPAYKNNSENDLLCYVGPLTASQAAVLLKPSEFRIYYQVPEKSVNNLPYKLRLFLAYKSSQNNEVFHFPIVYCKSARTAEKLWSLRYTDSPTFPTLSALIKYHKTYAYMDPVTGHIDTFPVWKDAIIDDDSS